MGNFKNISLVNFRNFDSISLDFPNNCNVFFGRNGSGKTNILEALSLLSKGRGLRKDKIANIIKNDCEKFIIRSELENKKTTYNLVSETYQINNKIKKKLMVNGEKSKDSLNLIYKFATFLIFLPDMERLFVSSPSVRRNFLDRFIFNHDNNYNKLINQYNKNILERSKLLNQENYDEVWLNQVEKNISKFAIEIYISREKQVNSLINYLNFFLNKFKIPYVINSKISDIFYNNEINDENFAKQLKENRNLDSIYGGCKIGPHKSDYCFYFNDKYLVSQLSTGQQKTLILLMYLSQCQYLISEFNIRPILLLDEICSHLDELNRNILLTLVESFDLQVFMTGTTKNLFSFLSTNTNFCNITL